MHGIDITSWLLDHPESLTIGRSLQDLIGKEATIKPEELQAHVRFIQAQLEQLKAVMPQEQKFISLCIYAVGQITDQSSKEGGSRNRH